MLQRNLPGEGEAILRYRDFEYTVVRQGAFVRCAVTGASIPLEELRYWNADLQEAYRSAGEALARWRQLNGKASA